MLAGVLGVRQPQMQDRGDSRARGYDGNNNAASMTMTSVRQSWSGDSGPRRGDGRAPALDLTGIFLRRKLCPHRVNQEFRP